MAWSTDKLRPRWDDATGLWDWECPRCGTVGHVLMKAMLLRLECKECGSVWARQKNGIQYTSDGSSAEARLRLLMGDD